jgi:hypothetical protein
MVVPETAEAASAQTTAGARESATSGVGKDMQQRLDMRLGLGEALNRAAEDAAVTSAEELALEV